MAGLSTKFPFVFISCIAVNNSCGVYFSSKASNSLLSLLEIILTELLLILLFIYNNNLDVGRIETENTLQGKPLFL